MTQLYVQPGITEHNIIHIIHNLPSSPPVSQRGGGGGGGIGTRIGLPVCCRASPGLSSPIPGLLKASESGDMGLRREGVRGEDGGKYPPSEKGMEGEPVSSSISVYRSSSGYSPSETQPLLTPGDSRI